MHPEPKINKNSNFNHHNMVATERVNKLLLQSIDTLEEILRNQQLPAKADTGKASASGGGA